MTGLDWRACTDPKPMLALVAGSGGATERKLRLLSAACCRRIWPFLTDARSREAVEVVELYADGVLSWRRLAQASRGAARAARKPHGPTRAASLAAQVGRQRAVARYSYSAAVASTACRYAAQAGAGEEPAWQAALVRDVFPDPSALTRLAASWQPAWNDRTLVCLAQAAYDECVLPAGTLDVARVGVLADALEDAGCTGGLLEHLRGLAPHVRGCWAVDALLEKSEATA
jgi:hypothetical protein